MNPVVQRELREQARQPAMFRMRLVAAAVVLAGLAWGFLVPPTTAITMFGPRAMSEGSALFLQMHRALVLIILALAPALTADAIARERREATLGLLGLTPLRPLDVALGKSAANALRALTLWLAPLPMIAVPLLVGGVGGLEVGSVIVFQLVLLGVGLAAGLAASTLAIPFRRCLALAYLLEAVLIGVTLLVSLLITMLAWLVGVPFDGWSSSSGAAWLANAPAVIFGSPLAAPYTEQLPQVLARLTMDHRADAFRYWAAGLAIFLVAGATVIALALLVVTRRTARAWHEEPPRPELIRLQRTLLMPVLFGGWLRRRQQRRLGRNPLLWLQHRTVAAALTRWGWLAVVLGIWVISLGDLLFVLGSTVAPLVLLGGMVFSAAGGFRAERENGTLELLLVTPLRTGQLLQSRCLAHLREFIPPVLVQLFLTEFARGSFRRMGVEWTGWNWWLISSLLALPWIGLWRGLRAQSFLSGVVSTALWALMVPLLATLAIQAYLNPLFFETPMRAGAAGMRFFLATRLDWGVIPAGIQGVIAVVASFRVWRELSSRQFALAPAHPG